MRQHCTSHIIISCDALDRRQLCQSLLLTRMTCFQQYRIHPYKFLSVALLFLVWHSFSFASRYAPARAAKQSNRADVCVSLPRDHSQGCGTKSEEQIDAMIQDLHNRSNCSVILNLSCSNNFRDCFLAPIMDCLARVFQLERRTDAKRGARAVHRWLR